MKKRLLTAVVAGMLVVGATTVATVGAEEMQAPSIRVLNVQDLANVFNGKHPGGFLHSVTLNPKGGNYDYLVQGFANGKLYTMQVDVLTGEVKKETSTNNGKDVAAKVFNPNAIITEKVAESVAVKAVGEGSIAKAWTLSADNSVATYEITVAYEQTLTKVTVDATTGAVLAKGEPVAIEQTKAVEVEEAPISLTDKYSPVRLD